MNERSPAQLTAAETAQLDQAYASAMHTLDALVSESVVLLDRLGPEQAAALLAAGVYARGPKMMASLLGAAIVRLQQQGQNDG